MRMADFLKLKKSREREINDKEFGVSLAIEFFSADGKKVYQVLPEKRVYRESSDSEYRGDQWPRTWTHFDPFSIGTLKHLNQSFDLDVGIDFATDNKLAELSDGESLEVKLSVEGCFSIQSGECPVFNSYSEFFLQGSSYQVQLLDSFKRVPEMWPLQKSLNARLTLEIGAESSATHV